MQFDFINIQHENLLMLMVFCSFVIRTIFINCDIFFLKWNLVLKFLWLTWYEYLSHILGWSCIQLTHNSFLDGFFVHHVSDKTCMISILLNLTFIIIFLASVNLINVINFPCRVFFPQDLDSHAASEWGSSWCVGKNEVKVPCCKWFFTSIRLLI